MMVDQVLEDLQSLYLVSLVVNHVEGGWDHLERPEDPPLGHNQEGLNILLDHCTHTFVQALPMHKM